jgi:HAE1 family hydrophobic/amphiphilic exporter-1
MHLLTKGALSRIAIVLLVAVFVIAGGIYSATQLTSELLPSIDIPSVTVITIYPGAAPDDVLRDVTEPLERALAGTENLKTTNSTSNDNISIVTLQYEYGTDMEKAQQRVQDLVNRVTLPTQVQRPTVSRFNFSDIPLAAYTLNTSDTSPDALSNLRRTANEQIVPELQGIPGVNSVTVSGGSNKQVIITLDAKKLAEKGLTASQVTGVLQANNVSFPAGTIVTGGQSVPVVVGHEFNSVDDLRKVVVGMQMPAGMGAPGAAGSPAGGAMPGAGGAPGGAGAPNSAAPGGTATGPAGTTAPGASGVLTGTTAPAANAGGAKAGSSTGKAGSTTGSGGTGKAGSPAGNATPGPATGGPAAGNAGAGAAAGGATTGAQGTGTQGSASGAAAAATTPVAPTPVQLQDVATVELTNSAASTVSRSNGKPSLALIVYKTQNANTVQATHDVDHKLDELKSNLPGMDIVPSFNQADYIEESLNSLIREGVSGAILAILVILLFLRSVRSTLVTAVSIPVSILIAFILLNVFDISLNIMSLAGLAVAVGRVVDDSIVVLENIYRHVHNGESVRSAAYTGTREVASAITSSTLTTVSVFLPLGFLAGLVSEIFRPFAVAVTLALLASLLVALTIVPVLATLFIKPAKAGTQPAAEGVEDRDTLVQRLYTPTLRLVLRNGWTKAGTLALALILFAGSLLPLALGGIGFSFLSFGSDKVLTANIKLKPGTDIGTTSNLAAGIEAKLAENTAVNNYQTTIGTNTEGAGSGFVGLGSDSAAAMTVNLNRDADVDQQANWLRDLLKATPNIVDYTVSTGGNDGGFNSSSFALVVSGPTQDSLQQVSTTLIDKLKQVPDLVNVTSDLAEAKPEIRIQVDPDKALQHGSTAVQIAGQVRALLTQQKISQITLDSNTYDVVAGYDPATVNSIDAIRDIKVGAVNPVPLSDVATVENGTGAVSITRVDQQRAVTLKGTITAKSTSGVLQEAQRIVNETPLPAGVKVQNSGVAQLQGEAFGQLTTALVIAVGLVYLVMVLFFGSLSTPFVIMFSLPLAAIGSFLALWITGRPFGISAMIGILMLVGIVVTNAIVLLDMVEQHKRLGFSTHESLIYGGRIRVRPILMTAIATIIALIPLALSNEGSLIAAELGTVVIGGLFTSTMLTLIVVPVVYSILDSIRHRITRRGSGTPADEVPEPANIDEAREPELVGAGSQAEPAH